MYEKGSRRVKTRLDEHIHYTTRTNRKRRPPQRDLGGREPGEEDEDHGLETQMCLEPLVCFYFFSFIFFFYTNDYL
jgi:hypothetical protein